MGEPENNISPIEGKSYDDEPDETLGERVLALSEIFPERVRNVAETVSEATVKSTKALWKLARNGAWIFFTSSIVLFAPVVFETERAALDELQKSQQKQVLLGPGTATMPIRGN